MFSKEMLDKVNEMGAEVVVEARPFAAMTVITQGGELFHLKQSLADYFGNVQYGKLHVEEIHESDLPKFYPQGVYCGVARSGKKPVTAAMRGGYTLSAADFQ